MHRIWNQVRNASRFDTPAYEIVGPIGAGGMGEVYRARDGQLERDVAIKVLPAELVADASRVNRFLQEARAASALDHPHVIAVYDIGEAESLRFMAMELVDGATLRDLTAEGPLERRKAVKIVLQVAEALTAAHAAGGSGYAKVLDFGLAKLRIRDAEPTGAASSTSWSAASARSAASLEVEVRDDVNSVAAAPARS